MSDTVLSDHALYQRDFYLWTQRQAAALRRTGALRPNEALDYENLAEEIESLGKNDRRALRSNIEIVLVHLLKLELSPIEAPRDGSIDSVAEHRTRLEELLGDSPSLRKELGSLIESAWRSARPRALRMLARDGVAGREVPEDCGYAASDILDPGFLPVNRHGLRS